ncbi:MAG: hypothetical protein QOF11_1282 [Chloroflexota bacterium]|jgi:hypothetical protein|nr:hypothetical protein [Chloroflexota bacterium]
MERWFALYRTSTWTMAAVALVVANLVPLVGVLFFGWNVWTILIVYWLENGVVGVFNVLKMWRAGGPYLPGRFQMTFNGRPAEDASKAGLIGFFSLHYGIFWTVHGVFVLAFAAGAFSVESGAPTGGPSAWTILVALFALFVSHGLSYRLNYIGRGEYLHTSTAGQMFAPYGRLIVLHVTIIVGAIAISTTGAPEAAVVILVALKTLLDLGLHFAERRQAQSRSPA